jgi:threonine/homoserine/homoserine lactone efflux protein
MRHPLEWRHVVGWTLYVAFLLWLAVRIWKQTGEANQRQALLEEMRQREHDRPKPPRRYVAGKERKPA